MGFFISILYLVTYYLTPATIFGPLAAYRIELIFAVLVTLVSLPCLPGSSIWKTPQSLALIGLALATFMSIVVGAHWAGGGVTAILLFLPNVFAYYLVCIHCTSKRRLQIIVGMMVFVCLFVITRGVMELRQGLPTTREDTQEMEMEMDNSYFMGMNNDAGEWFYRLRGMGEIHDPNDFAQLIVATVPLLFIFWKKNSYIRNTFVVLLPLGVMLFGDYLTHSRGSILALLAVVIIAARRRIGTIPAVVLAIAMFSVASALHFAGGREISTTAGEDRTELWGEGLQLLKSHPLFGVGFGDMPDYTGAFTAHNTIVVCAAELGFVGLYFWSMFLFPSIRDSVAMTSAEFKPNLQPEPEIVLQQPPQFRPPNLQQPIQALDQDEVRRLGQLMLLSFTGFLVAGWFLSRAYVLTLFLMGGMTEAIFQMGLEGSVLPARLPLRSIFKYSFMTAIFLVVLMWVILRIVNLTH